MQKSWTFTRRQALQALAGLPLASLLVAPLAIGPTRAQARTAARGPVLLSITGAISRTNAPDGHRRYDFDAEMIDALPVHTVRTGTPWHKGVTTFSGPLLADVLDAAGASGPQLLMTALNDYQVRMPIGEVLPHQPILARRADGRVLSVRDKGPLFLIFSFDERPQTRNHLFHSRSIWQLRSIDVR